MNISKTIRREFLSLLTQKYSHKEIQNSSLIPVNDPSVLFTTAGMHPLVVYLLGEKHPLGQRLVNVQRCFRTVDIDEVGDTIHHTLFEMLGYWSLGDYFKELSIDITFDFYVNKMQLDPQRMYVTVFVGNNDVELDIIAIKKWQEKFKTVGISAEVWDGKTFNEQTRIFPLKKEENWWGPAGETGPCGPDSEFFYWRGKEKPDFEQFVPWDNSNMFIEVSNNVFMGYNQSKDKKCTQLTQKNVDFGGGFERIILIKQLKSDDGSLDMKYSVYDTELFDTQRLLLEQLSGKSLQSTNKDEVRNLRIILDHLRASVFLINDGVTPSNKDRGYILRRLIRRVMRAGKSLQIEQPFILELAESFFDSYSEEYTHFEGQKSLVLDILKNEVEKFEGTLVKGLRQLELIQLTGVEISGVLLFNLFETYGFPCELSLEVLGVVDEEKQVRLNEFNVSMQNHQNLSRTSSQGRFKGGLSDISYETVKLHTLQHVFLKALQKVVSKEIHQCGSNITHDRFRIDVNLDRKLTEDEVVRLEKLVNDTLASGLDVTKVAMAREDAEKIGAEHEFGQKYLENVSVYFVGRNASIDINDLSEKDYFSAEFCGGPHVSNTSEILVGEQKFKVLRQEKIGSGIVRIKGGVG